MSNHEYLNEMNINKWKIIITKRLEYILYLKVLNRSNSDRTFGNFVPSR